MSIYDNSTISHVRAVLKNYFLTGKRPTEEQYHYLIDSIMDKNIFSGDLNLQCRSIQNLSALTFPDINCNHPLFIYNNVSMYNMSANDVIVKNLTADNINILHYEISGFEVAGDLEIQNVITVSGAGFYLDNLYVSGLLLTPCGDSSDWCSVFNTVMDSSARWDNVYNTISTVSGRWDDTYEIVSNKPWLQYVPLTGYSVITGPLTTQSINLNGGSISNVGNNSIEFQSGTKYSSESIILPTVPVGNSGKDFIIRAGLRSAVFNSNGKIQLSGTVIINEDLTVATISGPPSVTIKGADNANGSGGDITLRGGDSNSYSLGRGGNIVLEAGERNLNYGGTVGKIFLYGDTEINGDTNVIGAISSNSVINANCGNSTQWCEAYQLSLSALTGVSINGVSATYSNHLASFTGLTFGDVATITAINLNGVNQSPVNKVVSLDIPLNSYVPLSGNAIMTGPLTATNLYVDQGNATQWNDAYTWGNHVTASIAVTQITPNGSNVALISPINGPVQYLKNYTNGVNISSVSNPNINQYHLVTLLISGTTLAINWDNASLLYGISFPTTFTGTDVISPSGVNSFLFEYRPNELKPIVHIVDNPEDW